jgi:hypothetical protein
MNGSVAFAENRQTPVCFQPALPFMHSAAARDERLRR